MPSTGKTFSVKTRRMTKTEAAWLAGLFDGEGSLIDSKRSGNQSGFCLRFQICMCNEEIIRRVQTIIGTGNITYWKPKNPKHSESWRFHVHGMNAVHVLEQIFPWLIVKRELAEMWILQYITVDPS